MRLDSYLAEYWPEKSRSQWQKLCHEGHVRVNGDVVTIPKFKLGEDDSVSVELSEEPDYSHKTLPVLYEDENVTVINKPAGVLTHAKGAPLNEFTVAEFMRGRSSDKPEGNRPGIVHRLDRDTSGVMVCARTPEAHSFLQRQFSERNVKKTYIAVLDGVPKHFEATIRLPIERNPKAPATFRVGPNGKPAETFYTVVWQDGKHSIVRLQPLTGRTHQLRVHMDYLGTPVYGDRFYGRPRADARLGLHAARLELTIPGGSRKTFTADIPTDMQAIVPEGDWRAAAH